MKSKVMAATLAAVLATSIIGATSAYAEDYNASNNSKSYCSTGTNFKKVTVNGIDLDVYFRKNFLLCFLFGNQSKPEVGFPGCDNDQNVVPPSQDNEVIPPTGDNEEVVPPNGDIETPPSNDNDQEVVPPTEDIVPPTDSEKPAPPTNDEITPPEVETPPTVVPPSSEDNNISVNFMAQVEQNIYNIVNQERAKAGLSSLSYNSTMEKYARIKSQDMGDNNYFSHEDLSGNLITKKMIADGVSYNAWGENIAYIGGSSIDAETLARKFMTNWMNSSGHRANILSTNFDSIGVGVYKIGNKVYATQEFYR